MTGRSKGKDNQKAIKYSYTRHILVKNILNKSSRSNKNYKFKMHLSS